MFITWSYKQTISIGALNSTFRIELTIMTSHACHSLYEHVASWTQFVYMPLIIR